MVDTGPAKWHLAHYNAAGPMDGSEFQGLISRLAVAETIHYQHRVDEAMREPLAAMESDEEPQEQVRPFTVESVSHLQLRNRIGIR
jgi:predicted transcriptional regulator